MPDQLSDPEALALQAEWLSRLADTIERVTDKLADSIAEIRAEQGELRDEVLDARRQLEALEARVDDRLAESD